MRRILPVVFGCVLLAVPTFAQRGGHGGAGGGHAGGGGMRGGGSSGFHAGSSGGAYRGSAAYRGAGGYRGGVGRSGGFRVNNGYRSGYGFRGYGYYGWPYYYPGLYAGYNDPFFWDSSSPDPYYNGYPSSDYGDVGYAYAPPAPEPPAIVQQTPAPALREYPAPAPAQTPQAQKYQEPLYLLAMNDGTIRAVLSYWADGSAVRYVTLDHEQKQAPLSSIDRALSERLNRERNVPFRLPG